MLRPINRYGAKILQGTGVMALRLREDGRWVVTTPQGDILANRVVNAAGNYALVPVLTNTRSYHSYSKSLL